MGIAKIHESKETAIFTKAFYETRPGQSVKPTPPTDHYCSIYTHSYSIDAENGAKGESLVEVLSWVRERMLPVLERLMTECGFGGEVEAD
ncbi:hypothetical protein OKW28_007427 [Paraburkholderia sp. 40]